MSRFLCKQILCVIAIGLLIRYILGFTLTYTYDVHSWARIISNFEAGLGLYDISGYNYAPVWGYILGTFSTVLDAFGIGFFGERITDGLIMESQTEWFLSAYAPSIPFVIAFKTMLYLIDIVVGYVIYVMIRERYDDHKKGVFAFTLWFLCPFVIAVGAVGGMFDALSALMVLITIYWCMKGNYFGAGIMLGLSTVMKLFPGVIIPILVVYILHKHKNDGKAYRNLLSAIVGFAMISMIMLMPSIMDGHLSDCFGFLTNRASSSMGLGLGAIERYGTTIAYILIVLAILFVSLRYHKKGLDNKQLIGAILLCLTILFLFPATPQYILLITPILIICIIGNRKFLKPYLVLCIGTTMFAVSMNVANLLPLAAFTDLIDLGTFESLFMTAFNVDGGGVSITAILYYGGAILQYLGTLLILATWIATTRRNEDVAI